MFEEKEIRPNEISLFYKYCLAGIGIDSEEYEIQRFKDIHTLKKGKCPYSLHPKAKNFFS